MLDGLPVGDRLTVGEVEVQALSDGYLRFEPTAFFPGTTDHDWAADRHRRYLDPDGKLTTPIGVFLLRTGGRTVLVDCGLKVDDGGDWRGGRLMDALAATGVQTGDVDTVVISHLHWDHTGWTVSDGRPTFENATYRCHADDLPWAREAFTESYEQRIEPIAARIETVEDGTSVAPGVTVRAAPGHTPGHVVVVLASRGERALLLGDAIHCPVQLTETDWTMMGDADPAMAVRTREALLRELDGTADVAATAHFPGLRFGRVVTGGEGRTWVTVPPNGHPA